MGNVRTGGRPPGKGISAPSPGGRSSEQPAHTPGTLGDLARRLPAPTVRVEGERLEMNSAAEGITGYGTRELPSLKAWQSRLPQSARADWLRYLADVRAGFPGTTTLSFVRKDGEERALEVVGYAGAGEEIWLLRDVTNQGRIADAVARERERLARELHDSVGGTLSGISMLAEALRSRLARASSPEAQSARELKRQIERCRRRLRRVTRALTPLGLEQKGLVALLEELAADTQAACGVECLCKLDGPLAVDDSVVATHLFRIAQQAVTNAVEHGAPDRIVISLSGASHRTVLEVRDDGTGPPHAQSGHGRGTGIHTMQYRAGMIGGTLQVRPDPRGGTVVTCTVPTDKASEDHGA